MNLRSRGSDAARSRAAVTLVVVWALVLAAIGLVLVARTTDGAVRRARAQAAADAAALAGAADGAAAARRVATANGAQLRSLARVGDDVVVAVVLDEVRATARARATLHWPWREGA